MSNETRIPVAILAGGRSPEHDISLRSGREIARVVDRRRWRLYLARLERHSRAWSIRLDEPAADEADPFAAGPWVELSPGQAVDRLRDECGVRIVFPALHGPLGEDGSLQGFLQLLDMPFVGSDVAASAVAMDKLRARECFAQHAIPMPAACTGPMPHGDVEVEREIHRVTGSIRLPAFAKVDVSGSSIGVARVADVDALRSFFRTTHLHARRYLVEAELKGEEISIPVLGNSGADVRALPPIGIYPVDDPYFTFDAKYTEGACEEVVPPRGLSERQVSDVMALAERCHTALQCDGLSRTDMIVTSDGPLVLETNTIPGFTEASLFPKAAAHIGLSFTDLVTELFELAARRFGIDTMRVLAHEIER